MKRALVFLAVVLAGAGAASAAPLLLPPARITAAQAEELHRTSLTDRVLQVQPDGRTAVIGFLLPSRSPKWAGAAYVWCSVDGEYAEFLAHPDGPHRTTLTIPLATTLEPTDRERLRAVILQLYARCQTFLLERDARAAATKLVPQQPAAPRPVVPQPTLTEQTVLDRTLLATSSRLLTFWEEHRYLSILGFVLLGCVLGTRVRTRGPRPIELRQDDVLAALSASEQKLAASRARLQQLSTAIDAEEAQFVERVSALIERR